MRAHPIHTGSRSRGFTLIEVLVGIAIGMIGVLVMYKTITLFDARTRATVGGGDAQVAGAIATYTLERDLKLGGMGFGQAEAWDMGCTVYGNDGATPIPGFPLMPVQIVDNDGAGLPDEIRVLYGNSPFFPLKQEYTGSTATSKRTRSRNGFKPGDLAVITDNSGGAPGSSNCALVQVTGDNNVDLLTLDHANGSYTDYYTATSLAARYNGTAASVPFSAGNMYSLGPDPRHDVWTVAGDSLRVVDTLHGVTSDVAEGVVDLKAQYGIDTNGDRQISSAEWTKTPPAGTDWKNVLAIRIAVLVRNRNFEKPATGTPGADVQVFTAANPKYFDGAVAFTMRNVNGTPDTNTIGSPNNWRYYRYRVFERVIPLRNMLW